MDKDTQQILKKAERIFSALDKGDKSRCRYAQLAELRQELDALMPNELPPFLKKTKFIEDGELIVGNTASKPGGIEIKGTFPEEQVKTKTRRMGNF